MQDTQSSDCNSRINEFILGSVNILEKIMGCGIESDVTKQNDGGLALSETGKDKLCAECTELLGLESGLPDIEALQNDCTDATSVRELVLASATFKAAKSLYEEWKSCGPKVGKEQEAECRDRISDLGKKSMAIVDAFTEKGPCGLDDSDVPVQGDGSFIVTEAGKAKLCSKECKALSGLEIGLSELEALRSDCTDPRSVTELTGPAAITSAMAIAMYDEWQSCEVDIETDKGGDCNRRFAEATETIRKRLDVFTGTCGVLLEDIQRQGEVFKVTLDGKSKLCSPTCQGAEGVKIDMPDLLATLQDCHENQMVREFFLLTHSLIQSAKTCETTSLRHDLDCDCDFKWNDFQHAYAIMKATGNTTPQERSAMYRRYKKECGCEEVGSNTDGIVVGSIVEGEGAHTSVVMTELDEIRKFLLLAHIHKVVMKSKETADCEGAKTLFSRWDFNGDGNLGFDDVLETFAKYREYQEEQLNDDGLDAVADVTDNIFGRLDERSKNLDPIVEEDFIALMIGEKCS